jgi:hypothetical protein
MMITAGRSPVGATRQPTAAIPGNDLDHAHDCNHASGIGKTS